MNIHNMSCEPSWTLPGTWVGQYITIQEGSRVFNFYLCYSLMDSGPFHLLFDLDPVINRLDTSNPVEKFCMGHNDAL